MFTKKIVLLIVSLLFACCIYSQNDKVIVEEDIQGQWVFDKLIIEETDNLNRNILRINANEIDSVDFNKQCYAGNIIKEIFFSGNSVNVEYYDGNRIKDGSYNISVEDNKNKIEFIIHSNEGDGDKKQENDLIIQCWIDTEGENYLCITSEEYCHKEDNLFKVNVTSVLKNNRAI